MTEEIRQQLWDQGWDAYWKHKQQYECPSYSEQELRDVWMLGWLSAQNLSQYEQELHEELTNSEDSL